MNDFLLEALVYRAVPRFLPLECTAAHFFGAKKKTVNQADHVFSYVF